MAAIITTQTGVAGEVSPRWPDLIVKTPDTCGGRARIAGTRIAVQTVATWVESMGMTPAQVVAEYPHLSPAQVYAALAYYWSHLDEMAADRAAADAVVAEMQARAGPSKLPALPAELHAADDPLSH
jgi:uncharacterized protein (DUF433 family)